MCVLSALTGDVYSTKDCLMCCALSDADVDFETFDQVERWILVCAYKARNVLQRVHYCHAE
jgi:hypothetical protein